MVKFISGVAAEEIGGVEVAQVEEEEVKVKERGKTFSITLRGSSPMEPSILMITSSILKEAAAA